MTHIFQGAEKTTSRRHLLECRRCRQAHCDSFAEAGGLWAICIMLAEEEAGMAAGDASVFFPQFALESG